jgi:dTMP kinase
MNAGRLLVFEGGDGIGKSHLATLLTSHLREIGISVLQLSFPGRREGSLGNLVYAVHHDPARFGVAEMTALALQALHIAAHLDEIASIIVPALSAGTWVVLDRFWWSTWVYGISAGADRECLDLLIAAEQRAWSGVRPAAVFVIERQRALREEHSQETFELLKSLYSDIRRREEHSQPTFVLDNNDLEQSKIDLFRFAGEIIDRFIEIKRESESDV